jgi:hypothetical protein
MRTLLGPTVGALFTIVLNEALRVAFGTIGAQNAIYGIILILFIIFMPQGIVGLIEGVSGRSWRRWRGAALRPCRRRASSPEPPCMAGRFFIAMPKGGR